MAKKVVEGKRELSQKERAEAERIKALVEYYTASGIRQQIQALDHEISQKIDYGKALRKALKKRRVIEQKEKKNPETSSGGRRSKTSSGGENV